MASAVLEGVAEREALLQAERDALGISEEAEEAEVDMEDNVTPTDLEGLEAEFLAAASTTTEVSVAVELAESDAPTAKDDVAAVEPAVQTDTPVAEAPSAPVASQSPAEVVAADSNGTGDTQESDGDSDSIGTITGSVIGARLGIAAIPASWRDPVEDSVYLHDLGKRLWRNHCK